jgi:hypothetical protein
MSKGVPGREGEGQGEGRETPSGGYFILESDQVWYKGEMDTMQEEKENRGKEGQVEICEAGVGRGRGHTVKCRVRPEYRERAMP